MVNCNRLYILLLTPLLFIMCLLNIELYHQSVFNDYDEISKLREGLLLYTKACLPGLILHNLNDIEERFLDAFNKKSMRRWNMLSRVCIIYPILLYTISYKINLGLVSYGYIYTIDNLLRYIQNLLTIQSDQELVIHKININIDYFIKMPKKIEKIYECG